MAFPKIVVPTGQAALFVQALIQNEKGIAGLVIGESTDRKGGDNEVAGEAREFAERIRAETGVEVFWEWEGYSSGMAKHVHSEGRARGTVARKTARPYEVVDAGAAAIILQSFLDKLNRTK
jgi:RNase H-fold protein (predicted Holliday junction resolvase)